MSEPRGLGVIEAVVAVRDQCPNGSAQAVARQALEAIARGGASAMPEQVFLVLGAIQGWRGDRAAQVKQALRTFLGDTDAAR